MVGWSAAEGDGMVPQKLSENYDFFSLFSSHFSLLWLAKQLF